MEGSRWHSTKRIASAAALALCLITGAALVVASPASGDDPRDDGYTPRPNLPEADIRVESGPDGVTIYIGISETSPGGSTDSPPTGGGDGSGGWSCSAYPMSIGNATREWFEEESPLHPGELPWIVWCNDEFMGIVWIPADVEESDINIVVVAGDSVDPASVAAELRDHVPVPDVGVGVNPATGMVAMPSWFWVEGYDGAPIRTSRTLGDTTVEVKITPTGYRWSFGDGATRETNSLGQPYPQVSDIRHTYQQSSLTVGGAFRVAVEITFSVRYRVDGGPWQPLDPITRSFATAYPVQQLQSILTGQ